MTQEHQSTHHQVEPGQEWHFAEGHAGTAEAQDGGDKVDGSANAAEPRNKQAESPKIGAVSERKCPCCEWSICEPTHVRRAAGTVQTVTADETEIEKQAAEGGEPETKGIEAGKGHVSRADHQREEVIAETKKDGHGDEKNHGGAMHGEHLVEELRGNEMIVRNDELNTHDGGFNATDHEEQDGVEDIQEAETLVVNGGDPGIKEIAERARRFVDTGEGHGFRGHAAKTSGSSQGLQISGNGLQIGVA